MRHLPRSSRRPGVVLVMQVFLPDIRAATIAAISHGGSRAVYAGKMTLADFGNHALFALDKQLVDVAHRYLRDAAEMELDAGLTCGFADAYQLLLKFIDQVKAMRGCLECGAERGRDCVVNNAHGSAVRREWVHDARIGKEVVA